MPAPPLTVRNLSSVVLELKLVERYDAPTRRGWFGRSSGSNSSDALAAASYLAVNAGRYSSHDVAIVIEPFKVCETDPQTTQRTELEVLRLTFEAAGEKYRIEVPCTKKGSQTLCPLAQNPKHEFTGVFVPEAAHLAIYDTANLDCWMKFLRDETPLSALSIPGTHNSPTCFTALPSVRCQACTPREQLENGVRFFDVRVQPEGLESPNLALVHSAFPISLTGAKYFRNLVDDVFRFLERHPSETLIMSVKREGTGKWDGDDLAHVLQTYYTTGAEAHRWYIGGDIPLLSQVRGKIVLLRRFNLAQQQPASVSSKEASVAADENGGPVYGIDASTWADNAAHTVHGNVCVQDFYEVLTPTNISEKVSFAQAQCRRAAACIAPLPGVTTDRVNPVPPQPFYINFLSASNFWRVGCWPESIARVLNPSMVKWLCCEHGLHAGDGDAGDVIRGDGSTGIVVCDWVGVDGDWDLVRCIVGMNSRLIERERCLKS